MALYSAFFLVEFLGIIIAVLCAIYVYFKYVAFDYWSSRNVVSYETIVPFGSMWPVFSVKYSMGEFFRDAYLKFKKNPFFGVYTFYKPALVINDPDIIRLVLTKDFTHFHDRGVYSEEKIDPLSAHLFAVPGAKWKYLRTKFSPTFTSSKMKQMFFTVKDCSETLAAFVADKAKNSELVEVKDLVARFSTDVIASTAFGLDCKSIENPDVEFRKMGRKAFATRPLTNFLSFFAPSILKTFRMPVTDKDVTKFFISAFKETVQYRQANNIVRKDFMDLIMQLMNKGYVKNDDELKPAQSSALDSERITMMEGAAQAFVFWLAGFETSSSTVTHCLYELALHQDLQDKVADEINTVLQELGGVSYDSVKAMPYLAKVVDETLRKYPSVPILNRECTKKFELPGTGLRIEKGTAIVIPVLGIQSDPDIYPEPEKFDPERFNEENVASRHQYTYLPFGEGPRNCIGMRFGLVQTKVAIISLLSKYRFKPGPNLKVPMVMDKGNLVHCPDSNGIVLRIEERHLCVGPNVRWPFFLTMGFLSSYFVVDFLAVLIAIIFSTYLYMKYVVYNYWSSRNIDYIKPVVPIGNLGPLFAGQRSIGELFHDVYAKFKKIQVVGIYIFHRPSLVVNDPDLIRLVLTKEFSHFHDRGLHSNEKVDPLSMHLFVVPGERWKYLRTKFTPTFTASKMKQMFFTIKESSETLATFVGRKAKNSELIEFKDLIARYATDVIASAAFGIECNSIENPDADFRKWGRRIFQPRPLKNVVALMVPYLLDVFRIRGVDKEIADFFIGAFKETVEYRMANNVVRRDFLDLVMQLMQKGSVQNDDGKKTTASIETDTKKITIIEGAAQAFVFWAAGFETTSSTVTHTLYELSVHPEIQDKVAKEINTVIEEFGEISYDSVKAMPYLDKVVAETLRKYPPVPMLNRECTKDFEIPGVGLRVQKGVSIVIPTLGLHMDPEIYPEPEKYDPERFTEENIASRHQYSYLPFGEGPRICIGKRFGQVQTKVALVTLLSKYRFKPGPGLQIPLIMDKGNLVYCTRDEVVLRAEER
ncbi:uncharacterized protein LOC124309484 [Neodiprion virginianus]|uniref:uncharacterized protein LOC124309484 n=1 Tax=Neodiprion virginianus TaxID=2961670 RepID=UPI001EE771B5|nr:uncharacterized protein LOC124309484 [Neodiprion virginianus]